MSRAQPCPEHLLGQGRRHDATSGHRWASLTEKLVPLIVYPLLKNLVPLTVSLLIRYFFKERTELLACAFKKN